jgi:hypothetical protein
MKPPKPSVIHWACSSCGASGSSFRRDGLHDAGDGKIAAALHLAVSPDCNGDEIQACAQCAAWCADNCIGFTSDRCQCSCHMGEAK